MCNLKKLLSWEKIKDWNIQTLIKLSMDFKIKEYNINISDIDRHKLFDIIDELFEYKEKIK